MSRRTENLRLFVAAYPPLETAQELKRLVPDSIAPLVRKTATEQIHLTLLFLGNVLAKDMDTVIGSIDRSCSGQRAFELTFENLTALPLRGPKRTIVATFNAPAPLLEIRSRLIRRLSRQSRERPNDRFLPHFTVARFKKAQMLEIEQALLLDRVPIREIRLMRSNLTPTGSTHLPIHACALEKA